VNEDALKPAGTIGEKAELTGLSWRQCVALAGSDPRVFAPESLATPAAQSRLRRWADAGCPVASVDDVTYYGDPEVGELVRRALSMLPAPVLWHVATHVLILGVGRQYLGFCTPNPAVPAPSGEQPSLVVVNGADEDDDEVIGLVLHELAHAYLCDVETEEPVKPMPLPEQREVRRTLARAAMDAGDAAAASLVNCRVNPELQADYLAGLWAGRRVTRYGGQHRRFFERQLAAEAAGDTTP
jgi:hypothetical protein